MKNILVIIFGVSVLISGCAKKTTSSSGNGEYTQLTQRNVIYRDLTRPISLDNDSVVDKSSTFTAPYLIK